MKTSSSDNGTFPQFCEDILQDSDKFSTFRKNPIYQGVVETVSESDGKGYLQLALQKKPKYSKLFKTFSRNDSLGSPIRFYYNYGFLNLNHCYFSPTTLRYINTLADLEIFYKSLADFNIVEIGAGYGGLCRIIYERFKFKSYTIIDLQPCINLSKKYLDYFDIQNVLFQTPHQVLGSEKKYDLFISNYAFSEINREWQDVYFSAIIKNSLRGYMMCNFATHTWDRNQYSENELLTAINGSNLIKNSPFLSTCDLACNISLIYWDGSQKSES